MRPRVLVLTTYQTEADVLDAMDAGAAGYLLKDAPPDELFRAVRATARGETVLSPAVAAMMVRRASSPGPVLTAREVEILGLLAEGLGNKEMARRLLVSEATVKSHLDPRLRQARRRLARGCRRPGDRAADHPARLARRSPAPGTARTPRLHRKTGLPVRGCTGWGSAAVRREIR